MKTKGLMTAVVALFLSVGAYAQSQTAVPNAKPRLTPEQRQARKAEHKAKLAQMTPAERKAFKQTHREQRQARLNTMTPEKRERVMARHQQHKSMKRQTKTKQG